MRSVDWLCLTGHGKGNLEKLQQRTDFGKYGYRLLFEVRGDEGKRTNISDYTCVCIFTWCYVQTCCFLSDLHGWAKAWGRGSRLWLGLQVAVAFQHCLPLSPCTRPAKKTSVRSSFGVRRNVMLASLSLNSTEWSFSVQMTADGPWACRAICEPGRASCWLCPGFDDLFVLKACSNHCIVL